MARLAVVAVVWVAACSPSHMPPPSSTTDAPATDDASGAGDASPIDAVSAAQACAELSVDRCTKLQMCSEADLERRFGDIGTCETREALACTADQMAPDTAATPAGALACGDARCRRAPAATSSARARRWRARSRRARARARASSARSARARSARPARPRCAGSVATCRIVGTSCAASGCGPTLICADNPQTCQVPGTANSSCNEAAPCGNGFSCVGTTKNNPGSSKAEQITSGGACDPNHNTRSGCSGDAGLVCNENNNTCVNEPRVAAGQPCGVINGIKNACLAGATCVIAANQVKGTCVAPAADGAACNTSTGPDCFFPARCIPTTSGGTAGTCQLPGSASCL